MSGKLITNQESTLSEIINQTLPKTKDIRFLVGYFYFSGFIELYKKIGDKKLNILVGLDVDVDALNTIREYEVLEHKFFSKQKNKDDFFSNFVKLWTNTEFFDTQEKQESFKLFYEKIKNGTLEIRKTNEPNHAKMYLFEYEDQTDITLPGKMIIGSSNLSIQGLKKRNELNVVFNDIDYNEGKKYFKELWDKATIIVDQNTVAEFEKKVISKIWIDKLPTPYEVYLRVLEEFFRTNIDTDSIRTPSKITNNAKTDLAYQTDAIAEGLDRIERHNGVIIADVVGLGKSIIASTIANNLELPVIIITPPHLEAQWQDYAKEFHFNHHVNIFTSGKTADAVKQFADLDKQFLVIIDEAHRYRNTKIDAYQDLQQICAGNKVVLLTATPYNNKPEDIYALLQLFQMGGKSTLKNIDNLGERFAELIKKYKEIAKKYKKDGKETDEFKSHVKNISKKIQNIIAPVVIRRSRMDLKAIKKYQDDLKKQHIEFPVVKDPVTLEYNLNNEIGNLYIKTLNSIYYKTKDEDTDVVADVDEVPAGVYKAARYQPLNYAKDEHKNNILKQLEAEDLTWQFFAGAQKQLGNFIRRLLVHRFESSMYAFKLSLENILNDTENIMSWIKERKTIPIFKRGHLPDIDSIKESVEDDSQMSLFSGVDKVEEKIADLKKKGLFGSFFTR